MAWYDETASDAKGWLGLDEIVPMAREIIYKQSPMALPTTLLTNFQPQFEDIVTDPELIYRLWKKEVEFALTDLVLNWPKEQARQFERIAFPLYLKQHLGFGVIDMTTTPITVAIGEPFGNVEQIKDIQTMIQNIFRDKPVEIIITRHQLQSNGSDCSRLSAIMMQHLAAAPNLKAAAQNAAELPAFLSRVPAEDASSSAKYDSKRLAAIQRDIHTDYEQNQQSHKTFFAKFFKDHVSGYLVEVSVAPEKINRMITVFFDGLASSFRDVKTLIESLDDTQQNKLTTLLKDLSFSYLNAHRTYDMKKTELIAKYGMGTAAERDTEEFQDHNITALYRRHQVEEKAKQALVQCLFLEYQAALNKPKKPLPPPPPARPGKPADTEVVSTLKESTAAETEAVKPAARENLLHLSEETIKNAFGRSVAVTVDKTDPNCYVVKKGADAVLKIYADKLESDSEQQHVFEAMLKIYNHARFVRPPEIDCDPKLVATWTAAIKNIFGDKMYDVKINGHYIQKPEPPKEEESKKHREHEAPEMPFPMPGSRPRI